MTDKNIISLEEPIYVVSVNGENLFSYHEMLFDSMDAYEFYPYARITILREGATIAILFPMLTGGHAEEYLFSGDVRDIIPEKERLPFIDASKLLVGDVVTLSVYSRKERPRDLRQILLEKLIAQKSFAPILHAMESGEKTHWTREEIQKSLQERLPHAVQEAVSTPVVRFKR
ncbi:MAG: hypothetical protein HGB03_03255 [Candidatus Yonathbacteria bacterium]|nr:hypothetical protein [Candidatus Yonathbacteria bacterium]NTW47352.1 hypothetical protein [Candidatus Yonathbacteria bacterium]